jgi:hypothetical protein
MADNALAKQVGKKMPQRRKTRLEQLADEIEAYGGRVRDDFMAGAERSAQGLGDIVERGDVLTGIPRLALGGTSWMGAPVSAALSPVLGPILQPVGEAVNTYVGQPVEDLTGYPADITNDLAMTGLTLGAAKGLGMTRPYLARAADQVEGMANKAGYTFRKPANVYGSGPVLTRLADDADDGITAYHGSPHTFDKFSMDKIGTGEGAQAFGHGLYFAEAEDVAKGYRDNLTRQNPNLLADYYAPSNADDGVTRVAKAALLRNGSPSDAKYIAGNWSMEGTDRAAVMQKIDELAAKFPKPEGSMYQVRLNVKPDELVDWDKPLSEQPKSIAEAALSVRNQAALEDYKRRGTPQHLIDEYIANANKRAMNGNMTGGSVVKVMKENGLNAAATEKLKAAGVKGIKYKDAGSRQIEGGTYNYVIFDDSIIDILKRYGIPMTAAAGGGMMVMGQDMPPEVASQISG